MSVGLKPMVTTLPTSPVSIAIDAARRSASITYFCRSDTTNTGLSSKDGMSRQGAKRGFTLPFSAVTKSFGKLAGSRPSTAKGFRIGRWLRTRKHTITPRSTPSLTFGPEHGVTHDLSIRRGPQPENALTGTIFTVNAWRNDPLIVPAKYAALRFWRNTEIAKLKSGERAVLLKGLLGHEWDEDIDNGFRPPGLFHLSETTINNVPYIQDNGSVYDSGTATHHLTLYRHETSESAQQASNKGGALVFGAGTVQWTWGLDAHHDTETGIPPERANSSSTRVGVDPNGPDRNVQQATVNLFADMNVQPQTLQEDLMPASASTDEQPPTSTVLVPADGATLPLETLVISGTAQDNRQSSRRGRSFRG